MSIVENLSRIYEIEDTAFAEQESTAGLSTFLIEIRSSNGSLLLRGYTSANSKDEAQSRAPFAEISTYRKYPIYRDQMVHFDI